MDLEGAARRGRSRRRSPPAPATPRPTSSRDAGREVRVHGGEVESLTAATAARRRRPRLDRRPGRLRLRHRPQRAGARGGRRARRRGGRGRRRGRVRGAARSPAPSREAIDGPQRPLGRRLADAGQVAELALAVERAALDADPRVVGVEQAVYADSAERVAIALLDRRRRRVRGLQLLRLPAGAGRGRGRPRDRPRVRPRAAAPAALDPAAIGARGARERAVGDDRRRASPSSRACPVVLDPTVAASFVGLIGGDPRRRRRAARPLAVRRAPRRGGRQRGARPRTTTASTPQGLASAPFDGEGVAAPAHRADRGRPPAHLPLRHLHRPPRRGRVDRQRRPQRLPLAALGLGLEPGRRARASSTSTELLAEAGEGVYVTDVAGLHSGVNPVSGVFSVGASGPDDPRRRARPSRCASSRSPATWSRCCGRCARPARRRAGCRSAARSAPRRC